MSKSISYEPSILYYLSYLTMKHLVTPKLQRKTSELAMKATFQVRCARELTSLSYYVICQFTVCLFVILCLLNALIRLCQLFFPLVWASFLVMLCFVTLLLSDKFVVIDPCIMWIFLFCILFVRVSVVNVVNCDHLNCDHIIALT